MVFVWSAVLRVLTLWVLVVHVLEKFLGNQTYVSHRIKNLPERGHVSEDILNRTQAPCDNKKKYLKKKTYHHPKSMTYITVRPMSTVLNKEGVQSSHTQFINLSGLPIMMTIIRVVLRCAVLLVQPGNLNF